MRKFIIGLLSMLATACLAIGLAGCEEAVGIKDIYLNENKELIVELTDGRVENLGPVTENTPSNYSEGLTYTISEDGTYYSVSGIGICSDRDVVIPANYRGLPVKEIAENAFYEETLIRSITIPDSVTSIGKSAFAGCYNLTSIDIPDSVTSIGNSAFSSCDSLTSIEIPDSVTSIGSFAFYYCYNLTSVVIPDGVTSIGEMAFAFCYNLTSVVIPDSVTSIGDSAFWDCYKLVEVVNKSAHITVEKGSTSNGYLGYYALAVYNSGDAHTTKLSNDNGYIVYTDGEEKILVGYNGRETDLVIPSCITKIYQYAFSSCDSLTSVVIGDSVTSIGNSAFLGCDRLTSIEIPDSVTSIGERAFDGCSSLTSIETPDSVTSIGSYTFFSCDGLTSVVISDSVTSIGYQAFYDCDGLTSVVIPDSITSIGGYAFAHCDSLTSITFKGTVAQWNAISKNFSWNDVTPATKIVCTDGTVAI